MTGFESQPAARWRPEQFVLWGAGGLLLASGAIHVLVWLVDAAAGDCAVEDEAVEVVFDLVIGPCNRCHDIKTEVF